MEHKCHSKDQFGDLAEKFWNESNINAPKRLYHYCPTDSAINIINSRKMWASSFECMNDQHEFRFGFDLALEEVKEAIDSLPITNKDEIAENWKSFLEQQKDFPLMRPYILSFCDTSTNSHLWGNYANNGQGSCIELINNHIEKKILSGCLITVSYEAATMRSILKSRLEQLNKRLDACDQCLNDQLNDLFISYLQTIFLTCLSLKRENWAQEHEWRLVIFATPDRSPNSSHGDIQFRARGVHAVDYLEIDLCKAHLQINSASIGNNADTSSKNAMSLFLKKNNLSF